MRYDYTKTMILCPCGYKWDLCVSVDLTVPEPLRCHRGVPIARPTNSRSDICCPECRRTLFSADSKLRTWVEDELCRARERHVRHGTVVLDLR